MKQKPCYILGIESSCDDTAAAVLNHNKVLSNCITNQEIHNQYGGIVPELASRAHQVNIIPVVDQALKLAKIKLNQLDAIAYTQGPGLLGSLLVGNSFAKSIAMGLNIPLIGIEGGSGSEWVLVDLGDIIIHIMTPTTRQHYNLEELWVSDN